MKNQIVVDGCVEGEEATLAEAKCRAKQRASGLCSRSGFPETVEVHLEGMVVGSATASIKADWKDDVSP